MAWTIGYQPILSDRVDDALLTLGRSIYAASQFEGKCKFVLRVSRIVDAINSTDPVLGLEEAIASLPPDQRLARTLKQLIGLVPATKSAGELLHSARDARNFIAHEGAFFGLHQGVDPKLIEHLDKLHVEVRALAAGDNLVSLWAFHIEEPRQPKPSILMAGYEDALVRWVLGPVWDLLTNPSVDASVPGDGQVHERVEHYRAVYPDRGVARSG